MSTLAEAQLPVDRPLTIVGFGGVGTLDLYPPFGEMGPVTEPGAKEVWTNWPDELPNLLDRADVEQHIGGNVFNALALLATYHADVRLVSVIGEPGEIVSDRIRERMAACGIANQTIIAPGYNPSVSKITREKPGSDRILYGRTRDPLVGHMNTQYIRETAADADVVVVSSVNDIELVERIFDNVPTSAFLTFSPGSAELRNPGSLGHIMTKRKPDLLSVNADELARLLGMPKGYNPHALVEMASAYAKNVLCTNGTEGMILRSVDGTRTQISAYLIPDEQVVDTLGTGDRATAEVTHGLITGEEPEVILARAVRSTAEVARHVGAHGDLQPKIGGIALNSVVER